MRDSQSSADIAFCVSGWLMLGAFLAFWLWQTHRRHAKRPEKSDRIVDHVADIVLRYRPDIGGFDYVSPAIERITGYNAEAFLSMRPRAILQRICPDDRFPFLQYLARVLASDDADGDEVEYRWQSKAGFFIWTRTAMRAVRNEAGETDSIVATIRVSTLQKRVEAHAKDRTQRIISSFPGAVFRLVMSPDGSFGLPYITDGGLQIFGAPADTLTDDMEQVLELCAPECREQLVDAIRTSARTKEDINQEIQVIPKDEEPRWVLVRSRPRKKPDGRVLWDGVLLDITELKHAENEKAALQAQLYQSQKLEAVGRLAGGVAHDFNNLLTAILGYSSFLLKGLEEGSPRWREADQIRKAGEKAGALTQQLLAFSRRQVVNPVVLDVNECISGISNMLHRVIGEDIAVQLHLKGSPCLVKADATQVDQIIMNLVVNARDAMPQGGQLMIETENVTLHKAAGHGDYEVAPGNYVLVVISDTGCGMDETTRKRVFEPFFTTKETGKGTGLGMSTVYGAVKQIGGYVIVYSEVGRGTTVKVYLPQAGLEDSKRARASADASVEAHVGTESVLLVEDDGAVRAVAKRILEESGYTVLEADSGAAALKICSRKDLSFDLLLTDTIMPEMNGPELAKRVREIHPGIKIVFMSGYTDTVLTQSGFLDSGIILISKPFTSVTLTRDVRKALDA